MYDSIGKKTYSNIKKEFGGILSGKWTPFENLHITLKFLGNVEDEMVDTIKQTLSDILDREFSANLVFKGFSAFPNINNPKVFFIEVFDEDGQLESLHNTIESKLESLGFERENRQYHPHITLKRPKEVDMYSFLNKIKDTKNQTYGTAKKIKVRLIESIPTPEGAIYKII